MTYLKINKSIPIYYCEPLIHEIKLRSLQLKFLKFLETKKNEIQVDGCVKSVVCYLLLSWVSAEGYASAYSSRSWVNAKLRGASLYIVK